MLSFIVWTCCTVIQLKDVINPKSNENFKFRTQVGTNFLTNSTATTQSALPYITALLPPCFFVFSPAGSPLPSSTARSLNPFPCHVGSGTPFLNIISLSAYGASILLLNQGRK